MKGTLNELHGNEWVLLSYTSAWNVFRSHTVVLQDDAMRDHINCFIDSISDPNVNVCMPQL